MKFLIVLSAVLACAVAKPQLLAPWAIPHGYAYSAAAPWGAAPWAAAPWGAPSALGHPLAYSSAHWAAAPAALAYSAPIAAPVAAPIATATKSQYHAQDELGQASYGHSEPSQTHHAVQDAFGNKVGSFSYAAPDGRILRTDYVADALGYRVTSNALPVADAGLPLPVHDTPEVAIAKAQHLAAHGLHRIAKRSVALVQTPASTAPLAYAAPIAHHAIAAPLAYAAAPAIAHHTVAAPLAYAAAPAIAHHALAAPLAYAAAPAIAHHTVAAPLAYAAAPAIAHHAVAAPLTYAAAPAIAHHTVAAPLAYAAAPAVSAVHGAAVYRDAVHTTVVNNPGHAVSYRVD